MSTFANVLTLLFYDIWRHFHKLEDGTLVRPECSLSQELQFSERFENVNNSLQAILLREKLSPSSCDNVGIVLRRGETLVRLETLKWSECIRVCGMRTVGRHTMLRVNVRVGLRKDYGWLGFGVTLWGSMSHNLWNLRMPVVPRSWKGTAITLPTLWATPGL